MVCDHVLIATQSDILREGICTIIHENYSDCTIKTVSNSNEIISLYKDYPQALCLLTSSALEMDICSVIEKLDEINHHKKTILMLHSTNLDNIENALRAGVNGLFTHHCPSDVFIKILNEVTSGKNSYGHAVSELIMNNYRNKQSETPAPRKQITKRESEVLSLIVRGYTSAEIAEKLFISPRTVETHRCNLMAKLKIKNTAALVRFAMLEKM